MTHPELQDALAHVNITIDASEAHGWLSGALCVRKGYGAAEWLAELAADSGGEPPVPGAALAEVPAETLAALESDGFEFAPLLPDDDAPLADRVAALAAWSSGFLYGIGTGASEQAIAKAGDVAEFLRDLADIARAELEPGRAREAGESDYVELAEFVRAGAQLAFDELAAARAHAPG
jgi:uncharacterized protein YgfB (UPF0149 family)